MFLRLPISRIRSVAPLCVQLTCLRTVSSSRFICCAACVGVLFPWWPNSNPLFGLDTIYGHQGCFQSGAIMSQVAMDIFSQVLLWTSISLSLVRWRGTVASPVIGPHVMIVMSSWSTALSRWEVLYPGDDWWFPCLLQLMLISSL